MKAKLRFSSLALTLVAAVAACSDDDKELLAPAPTGEAGLPGDRAYITVSLTDVNDAAATRSGVLSDWSDLSDGSDQSDQSDATPTTGYADGSERSIHHIDFYFFDSCGKYVTTGQVAQRTPATETSENVEKKYQVVVALNKLAQKGYPRYLLTTVNYSLGDISEYTLADLCDLQKRPAVTQLRCQSDGTLATNGDRAFSLAANSFTAESDNDNTRYFIMTTSSYDHTKYSSNSSTSGTTPPDSATLYGNVDTIMVGTDGNKTPIPVYFVTKLADDNFVAENTTATATPVDVYVERLAAKVTVNLSSTNSASSANSTTAANNANGTLPSVTTGSSNTYSYTESNTNTNKTGKSDTIYALDNHGQTVTFVIEGFKLNGLAQSEYLFKQCHFHDWRENDFGGNWWSRHDYFRSFWANTPTYDQGNYPESYGTATGNYKSGPTTSSTNGSDSSDGSSGSSNTKDLGLNGWTLGYVTLQTPYLTSDSAYCMEHTERADKMKEHVASATSVLLKARILAADGAVDADGAAAAAKPAEETTTNPTYTCQDLYRYARKLYTRKQFLGVAIQYLKNNGFLNAWAVSIGQMTEQTESGGSSGSGGSGSDTTDPKKYVLSEGGTVKQVDSAYISVQKPEDSYDAYVNIIWNPDSAATTEAPRVLYKTVGLTTDGKQIYEQLTAADSTELLKKFNTSSYAVGYTQGEMYWNIPIRHLRPANGDESTIAFKNWGTEAFKSALKEGHYGVVRNHWYEIKVNTISTLGKGIYDPAEPIIPNTEEQTLYEIGANINILSWRKVIYTVDL